MHLRQIAKSHVETRFVSINAEKAPFFITKLAIKVLPTVVLFIDGIAADRVVGFEDLGSSDEFDTLILTRRLVKGKIIGMVSFSFIKQTDTICIDAKNKAEAGRIKISKGKAKDDSDDDDY